MKKRTISIIVTLAILLFSGLAFGQSADQGEGNRPARSRQGGGPGGMMVGQLNVDSTQKAVEAIEKQLAAIKKAMEGIEAQGGSREERNGGDVQAMREQMRQRTEAIQKAAAAISEQVLVLKGRQARTEFENGIDELQTIAASATTEGATKTAQQVQGIIDSRRKTFQETADRLGIPAARRGRQGRGPGLEAQEDSRLGSR